MTNKKKKLPNPVHFAAQRTFKMGIAPNKKDRIAKADRIQKQKGWEWDMENNFTYDAAVAYLNMKGISCDPCQSDEGEYVCDRLDDLYDFDDERTCTKEELDEIVEDVLSIRNSEAS